MYLSFNGFFSLQCLFAHSLICYFFFFQDFLECFVFDATYLVIFSDSFFFWLGTNLSNLRFWLVLANLHVYNDNEKQIPLDLLIRRFQSCIKIRASKIERYMEGIEGNITCELFNTKSIRTRIHTYERVKMNMWVKALVLERYLVRAQWNFHLFASPAPLNWTRWTGKKILYQPGNNRDLVHRCAYYRLKLEKNRETVYNEKKRWNNSKRYDNAVFRSLGKKNEDKRR